MASLLATNIEADSFKKACIKYLNSIEAKRFNGYVNKEKLSIWGCRLYDNEKQARKRFG